MVHKITFTENMKYEKCTVTKRSDGRYFCRIPVSYETDADGKKTHQYKSIYGVDENDVRIKRAEFIESQIQGAERAKLISEMLITKMEEWLYTQKFKRLKGNSFDRLENTLDYQIRPALAALQILDIRMNDVTTAHINQIMDYNLNKGYSYSTLLKIRRFLVSFFNYYEDEITLNPMRKYEFYAKESVLETQAELREQKAAVLSKKAQRKAEIKADGSSKIYITEEEEQLSRMKLDSQVDESDIHYFNDKEIELIKDAIYNGYTVKFTSRSGNLVESARYYPKQGEYFLFMMYTGIRCGEAISLQYSSVNFDKCTIDICQNAVNTKNRDNNGKATGKRNRKMSSPKTKSSKKTITVSPYAIEILKSMLSKEPEGYNGYIVHNDNHEPISSKTLWQRLNKLLRGVGLEGCGLHSLRHTCATLLYAESGGDTKFVCQQLRQTDPGFTTKTYIHQTQQRTIDILQNFRI